MSSAGTRAATRSKSRELSSAQDPRRTAPYSKHNKVTGPYHHSPSCDETLPLGNNNKRTAPKVSTPSPTIKVKNARNCNTSANNSINKRANTTSGTSVVNRMHKKSESDPTRATPVAPLKMSDNRGNDNQTAIEVSTTMTNGPKGTPPAPPPEAWEQTLEQLKAIGQQVAKLDKIEKTTDKLSSQMESLVNRTASLEDFAQQASTRFTKIESTISTFNETSVKTDELEKRLQILKNDIQQENDQRIIALQQEIQNHKTQIAALEKQTENLKQDAGNKQELLESFKTQTEVLKKEIGNHKHHIESIQQTEGTKRKAESSVDQLRQEVNYQKLKDQALRNRQNLVIIGLPEQPQKSDYAVARLFLKSQFNISKMEIDVAYRLGTALQEGTDYARPLVIAFAKLSDRNQIWRRRKDIKQTKDTREIHIQPDMPRKLRDDLQVLYRVAKAASANPKYKSATIRDYKLHLDGNQYSADELKNLPTPLRPSSLAAPKSENTMVFFSKFCVLSNHYPSEFNIQDTQFSNVEHFLAVKRATLSGDAATIQKAISATKPIEAKVILNSLKHDHKQEWEQMVHDVAIQGIRAKFFNNQYLADYLCDTAPLILGEASKDATWGIGLTLEDNDVLDNSKWLKNGNLLGRTLMQIRDELWAERNSSQQIPV